MKILITDFFLFNEFFYIHHVEIGLESYKEFVKKLLPRLTENLQSNL